MADWEYAPAPESRAIGRLRESYGMFVDGEFSGGEGGTLKTVNPADEEVLAEVAVAGEADVDRAVAAARRLHASDPLRTFALVGSACLALGTLQGPVQALPAKERLLAD